MRNNVNLLKQKFAEVIKKRTANMIYPYAHNTETGCLSASLYLDQILNT